MNTSEGQHRWDGLARKHERQDWGGDEYWEIDAEDGVARKEETDVYGCGERGNGWGWNDGGRYRRYDEGISHVNFLENEIVGVLSCFADVGL